MQNILEGSVTKLQLWDTWNHTRTQRVILPRSYGTDILECAMACAFNKGVAAGQVGVVFE